MNHTQIVSFLWSIADLIRDSFKRGKYQDVILPLTVLRRLDCVLADTKGSVLQRQATLQRRGLENLDPQLRRASGFAFYNTSRYDFEKLVADAPQLAANLRNYLAGFSPTMREVLDRFDFDNTISKLDEAGLLFQVVERFKNVDLHPARVDNPTMGLIFEELIRRFNESLDENPGEHFTPRDVVHLMADLMLADGRRMGDQAAIRRIYDPCCGSGGMLMIAKEHITEGRRSNGKLVRRPVGAGAQIYLYGQEVNPETWAIAKADILMKDPKAQDADNIAFGSTLSANAHAGVVFDYLIANPPYGKDWKRDEQAVRREHERGANGRFGPGVPRISDGQTLFLLHMLAHARPADEGGARIAIIMNGSPLFSGDAGSGESEIRRHILENDLLEALVALPEQLFYNTGIATYIWLLTSRKARNRRGKVQLIDATGLFTPLPRSMGDKRREITADDAKTVLRLHRQFRVGQRIASNQESDEAKPVASRLLPTRTFGFRKVTIDRPLRLNFQASPERIAHLKSQAAFSNLGRGPGARAPGGGAAKQATAQQRAILALLRRLPGHLYMARSAFTDDLAAAVRDGGIKLSAPVKRAILAALGERDPTAEICRLPDGQPEADPALRDTERVPLTEHDPVDDAGVHASVRTFFEREVKPYVPDAWINTEIRDPQDGHVGIVGYEINFKRYFFSPAQPRPLAEIEADIRATHADILRMLGEQTRS